MGLCHRLSPQHLRSNMSENTRWNVIGISHFSTYVGVDLMYWIGGARGRKRKNEEAVISGTNMK